MSIWRLKCLTSPRRCGQSGLPCGRQRTSFSEVLEEHENHKRKGVSKSHRSPLGQMTAHWNSPSTPVQPGGQLEVYPGQEIACLCRVVESGETGLIYSARLTPPA